jgi:hypothetical protein
MKKLISFISLIALLFNSQAQTTYKYAFTGDSVNLWFYNVPFVAGDPYGELGYLSVGESQMQFNGVWYQKLYHNGFDVGGLREDSLGRIFGIEFGWGDEFLLQDMNLAEGDTFKSNAGDWRIDSVKQIRGRKYIFTNRNGYIEYWPDDLMPNSYPIVFVEGTLPLTYFWRFNYYGTNGVIGICQDTHTDSTNIESYQLSPLDTCFGEIAEYFSIMELNQEVVSIYPNPIISSQFRIDGLEGVHYYEIFDVLGTSVQNGQLQAFENTINVSSLMQGVYWISFWNKANATKRTAKFVVSK